MSFIDRVRVSDFFTAGVLETNRTECDVCDKGVITMIYWGERRTMVCPYCEGRGFT